METEKNFAESELSLAVAERALEVVPSMPMTGWLDLPVAERRAELAQIKELAARIRQSSEVLVCVGIGGSYLGHKALIEALAPRPEQGVEVLFAGNSLDALALDDLLARLGGARFCGECDFQVGDDDRSADCLANFATKVAGALRPGLGAASVRNDGCADGAAAC